MSRRRHVRPSSPAVPRHRRSFDPTRLIKPGTIGAVVIAFAALLGLGGTAALWQDSATVAPATLTSGSIGVQQAGFSDAAFTYSSGALTRTTLLTITNPKSSDAQLSVSAKALKDPNGLFAKVDLAAWPKSLAGCDVAATPSGAWTGKWAGLSGLSAPLPAGAPLELCLRTTLPNVSGIAGHSYEAQITLIAQLGGWQSSTTASVTQGVAAATPSAPVATTCDGGDGYNVYIRWPNSTLSEPAKSNFRYNIAVDGKKYVPNAEPHGGWTEAQLLNTVLRESLKISGTVPVTVHERTSNGGNGALVAQGWVDISYANERQYVRCATGPATAPAIVPFSCETLSYGAVNATIVNPVGSHAGWKYDITIGSSRFASVVGDGDMSEAFSAAQLAKLAKSTTHQVSIVRSATGVQYFSGSIYIAGDGTPYCGDVVKPLTCKNDGDDVDLSWALPAAGARDWKFDVRVGWMSDFVAGVSVRNGGYSAEIDEDDLQRRGFQKNTTYQVTVHRNGVVYYAGAIRTDGGLEPRCA
ncbi:MAG: hypothetical protein ABW204_01055 [Microbacteriaceae bacterium]